MSQTLLESRIAAAYASEGKTDDVVYEAVVRALEAYNARGDLLDYGAGVGNLLRVLSSQGRFKSLAGADLYPRPDGVDARWLVGDLNEPLPVAGESFDAVVGSEVIEHLENPRATAREWFRLLRPGGLLVCSTPNNESWRSILSLVLRGHFIAFVDSAYPAHVCALVRKDLDRVLSEAGFADIKFFFTDDGGIPKMPHYKWQMVSRSLFRGLRYSDNVVVTALKPR